MPYPSIFSQTILNLPCRQGLYDRNLILRDVREAPDHLHSLGIVRDNISEQKTMLDYQGHAVLIDFGTAGWAGEQARRHAPRTTEVLTDEKLYRILQKSLERNNAGCI